MAWRTDQCWAHLNVPDHAGRLRPGDGTGPSGSRPWPCGAKTSPSVRSSCRSRSFTRPVVRPGTVARTVLLDRLIGLGVPAVISVVAPAGYGKTTLLAQWAESKQPRLAWLSADHARQRPDRAADLPGRGFGSGRADQPGGVLRPGLPGRGPNRRPPSWCPLSASMGQPLSIVVDHAEAVTNRECLDAITELALAVPAGSQFAIASRDILPLPTARLRARAASSKSALTSWPWATGEASTLLSGAGIELEGRRGPRPGRAHRGMAGRLVPGGTGHERRQPASRGRVLLYRRRPLHGRLPPLRDPRPGVARRGVVPHPHLDPRPSVRSALRRHP